MFSPPCWFRTKSSSHASARNRRISSVERAWVSGISNSFIITAMSFASKIRRMRTTMQE